MNSIPTIHEIQNIILENLANSEGLRYNKIKNFEIDPKRFDYHLDQLISKGLVEYDYKTSLYKLTLYGKELYSIFRSATPSLKELPVHVFIGLFIKQNNKIVVVKRNAVPHIGHIGIPTFYIKKDKFIHETAEKGFNDLGFTGDLKRSLILETIYKKDKIISKHSNMHVFHCFNPYGELIKSNPEGSLYWIEKEELLTIENGYQNSKEIVTFFENNQNPQNITLQTSYDMVTDF